MRGLAPDLPDVPGIQNVSFTGLALTNISQGNFRSPGATNYLHNVQDHVSVSRGQHNMADFLLGIPHHHPAFLPAGAARPQTVSI